MRDSQVAKLTYVLEGAERDSDRYDACMAWEDQLNFLVGDKCAEMRPRCGRGIGSESLLGAVHEM